MRITTGESAGFFGENGSLSPVADRGAGSTGTSGGTWHFHLPGKVPGIPAKMVHFPPWPAGAPAPQTPLAALAIPTPGESAGNFGENGSLSLVARRGTGSTGLSRHTCHFHLRGKCRVFRRKRFTFPDNVINTWFFLESRKIVRILGYH